MPHPRSRTTLAFCAFLAAAACSNGGSAGASAPAPPPTWTEVYFSATHHSFSFQMEGWTSVPIPREYVRAGDGRFRMFGDGIYNLTDVGAQTSGTDRYMLEDSGRLLLIPEHLNWFQEEGIGGMYSRVGADDLRSGGSTPDFFLTRILLAGPLSFGGGSCLGTRTVTGPIELAGDWHLLSLHVILEQAAPVPDSVGRCARGSISIASGAPGTVRSISGTGSQGTNGVTYGGTIQHRLDNGGDGSCNLTVSYQRPGQAADDRVMFAAARPDMVFGLDADPNDGEAGRLFLVRKFDSGADPARVPGRFGFGGQSLIVDPVYSRGAQCTGVLTLAASGDFTIDVAPLAMGGGDSYAGTWTLAADGGLTLSIPAGSQTWFAAIDRGYNSLVFVDDFVESGASPKLHLGFAVREKTPD